MRVGSEIPCSYIPYQSRQKGISMNKPLILYTALTKAVDNYNERNHYSRSKLADDLGFMGENASIQFSNRLNPLNHSKTLNDERKYILLHKMDLEDQVIFFTHYMKQFGLKPVAINAPEITFLSMHEAIDSAQIESAEAFHVSKMALKDGTLTIDELEAIVKEESEAEQAHAELRAMAEQRLSLMEEE